MNHPTDPRLNGENAPLSHRGALESRPGIAFGMLLSSWGYCSG